MIAGALYSAFCLLLDVCSVGALISGVVSGSLPAGLAIGYVATALACLGFLAAMDAQQLRHSCMLLILQQQDELEGMNLAGQLDALQDLIAQDDPEAEAAEGGA